MSLPNQHRVPCKQCSERKISTAFLLLALQTGATFERASVCNSGGHKVVLSTFFFYHTLSGALCTDLGQGTVTHLAVTLEHLHKTFPDILALLYQVVTICYTIVLKSNTC